MELLNHVESNVISLDEPYYFIFYGLKSRDVYRVMKAKRIDLYVESKKIETVLKEKYGIKEMIVWYGKISSDRSVRYKIAEMNLKYSKFYPVTKK